MEHVATAGLVPTSARSLRRLKLIQPRSIEATLRALRDADDPVLLAGGSDLVARFNEGLDPQELVSLAQVAELQTITADAPSVRIGAMVTHADGSAHAALRRHAPGFAAAWGSIANPRLRFSATLGGNIVARRVRYEGAVLLAAAQARLEWATPQGPRSMTSQALWSDGSLQRALQRSLLTAISIDTADLAAYFYERSMRPLLTFAVGLRWHGDGLHLCCAVATEYLRPHLLELTLPHRDLARVAREAREIATAVFAALPESFADPSLTALYARSAGAALLARRLQGLKSSHTEGTQHG